MKGNELQIWKVLVNFLAAHWTINFLFRKGKNRISLLESEMTEHSSKIPDNIFQQINRDNEKEYS